MTEEVIRIEGLDELIDKIETIEDLEFVKAGMVAAGKHIKGIMRAYPPVSRRPQPFVSDKQRRGFFAKLRSGEIEVPYRRGQSPGSQTLGRRWAQSARDGGLTQVIGNNAGYASLVQGPEQTQYHKQTGWKTTKQVAEEERETVTNFILDYFERMLK